MTKHLSHPKYRPDIDGLRAIAVLSVVAFHAFPNWVKGGFIGVDVFFVISGYLISTIIFENLDKGTFSFKEFYSRRIRRIFPALLLVLAVSYVLGWFTLLADEYKQLGKHIAGGAGFVSNIILWNESSYFDNASETKPLLHLWSLGVEEQFYIIYPLLIWFAWKRQFNLLTVTITLTFISLYLNIKGVKHDAVATFYSPQTRFWELMCGSLLAWMTLYKRDNFKELRLTIDKWLSIAIYHEPRKFDGVVLINFVSCFGLFLLVYGLFRINKELSFPGKWALVPVLGSILIIAASQRAWVNRNILSNRILVWFGWISFPLYLWHWLLLSFARSLEGGVPSREMRLAVVMFSIFLSWLTYKLIEKPLRFGRHNFAKVGLLSLIMTLVGYIGYYTYANNGIESRFPKVLSDLTNYKYDYQQGYREGTCFLRPEQDSTAFSNCRIEADKKPQSIFLWGDSHAAHLYPGYIASFGETYTVIQRTASGCPPFLNLRIESRVHCKSINDAVISLIAKEKPTRVVLSAVWTNYDLSKLDQTIINLKKIGITNIDIVGPVPQWIDGLPRQLYIFFKKDITHNIPYRMTFGLNPNFIEKDDELRKKSLSLNVNYISAKDIMCDPNGCVTRLGETGESLTAWDYGHLTKIGSEFLVSRFVD